MAHEIKEIYVAVAVDPETGDEGVAGKMMPNGVFMPLVASDVTRLDLVRQWAGEISQMTFQQVKLKKYQLVEVVETFSGFDS